MISESSKIPQPDTRLIKACIQGNQSAFREIVESTRNFAYNVAIRILLNQEDAKDAVQESYIKIWKNFARYKKNVLFTTWMYKIIVNTCIDKIKSNTIRTNEQERAIDQHNEENTYTNKDLIQHVKRLSQQLPYKQRIVFILKDLQDLSIQEVSELLNMKKGVVKSNLYYARKNIREKLQKQENGRVKNAV